VSRWSDVTDVALSESSADHRKRRLATTLRQLALCAVTAFGAVALVGALAGCSEGESGDPNACSTDNDCQGRGVICADNTCSEQACTDRSECGQNRTCFQGLCTPAECTTDSQCTDAVCVNLVCQDPNNQSCMSDADCEPFGKTCNPITGMCVESGGCQSDTDCDVNESCNTVTGECVPGCTEDVDCPDGQYCDAGSCEMGCRVGECPANEVCNTETRECGEQCTVSECAAMDMTCDPDTGQCVERTGGAVCESCTLGNHAECGAPNDVDRCISLSQDQAVCSVGCESDADCPSGFQCQSVTTTRMGCVPASGACEGCLVDGCPENEVCAPGTASCIPKTETCSPCSTDLECGKGNTCTTFQNRERCLPRCGSDGSCPTDFTCNEDLCEPDSGMCTSCDTDPSTCTDGQVLDEDKCMCVDCVSDSDCEAGQACARGTSQCFNGGTGECTADSDCTDGVCAGQMDTDPGVCVECEVAEDTSARTTRVSRAAVRPVRSATRTASA